MPEGVDKFCCIFDLENTGLRNFDTSALFVILDFFQVPYLFNPGDVGYFQVLRILIVSSAEHIAP